LAAEGLRDIEGAIIQAKRLLDAGAYMIMIESEGITENVKTWRTDVAAKIVNALSVQKSCLKPQNQKFLHGTSKTMALK
jgi:phosphosulfolactate synthase (CoM biosynthesis protein A)